MKLAMTVSITLARLTPRISGAVCGESRTYGSNWEGREYNNPPRPNLTQREFWVKDLFKAIQTAELRF